MPMVNKTWHSYQDRLLTKLKEEGQPLMLGGDGCTDSSGHSAEFGSYSVLEVESNVVLDVKLVQVSIGMLQNALCHRTVMQSQPEKVARGYICPF